MLQAGGELSTLLSPSDPQPVELVNSDGISAFVLCCEHAGRAIPGSLGDLGITAAQMDRHIAYDVGAEGLARQLSDLLDAPLIMQRYSRLVVDCNRPFEAPDCFPEVSDGTPIPANTRMSSAEKRRRFDALHQPFHGALARLLDQRLAGKREAVLVAVHSFTPRLAGGADRPWQLGVLSNRDGRLAHRFLSVFQSLNPGIPAAHNQPYVVDDESDYTIPVHGEARGLPHVLIEVRHDLIEDVTGQAWWAGLIADSLVTALDQHHSNESRRNGR